MKEDVPNLDPNLGQCSEFGSQIGTFSHLSPSFENTCSDFKT